MPRQTTKAWRNAASPTFSFDADPLTGVAVCDSYDYGSSAPWQQVGGTSLATPCWAGLIAIADQLRAAQNVPLLNGTLAQSLIYSIYENSAQYAAAFHDVSGGNNNGFSAGPGYDLVTGVGSPVANVLVPALVSTALYSANMNTNPGWAFTSGSGDQWAFARRPAAAAIRARDTRGAMSSATIYRAPMPRT